MNYYERNIPIIRPIIAESNSWSPDKKQKIYYEDGGDVYHFLYPSVERILDAEAGKWLYFLRRFIEYAETGYIFSCI